MPKRKRDQEEKEMPVPNPSAGQLERHKNQKDVFEEDDLVCLHLKDLHECVVCNRDMQPVEQVHACVHLDKDKENKTKKKIMTLPTDINRHIASFLDPKSATRFSMVSKDHEHDLKNQFEPNGVCELCNVRLDSKGNCNETEADMAYLIDLALGISKEEANYNSGFYDDLDEWHIDEILSFLKFGFAILFLHNHEKHLYSFQG